ncbi:MAG: NUDIX domain-containing protein [Mariprofundaceae bacterium]|nr:NUDIX domain-containing protein [Mariprofundaceae bacterium]
MAEKSCYQGFLSVKRHTLEHDTFTGAPLRVERENMERGDGVAVLLFDQGSDSVLLLEQFRIGPAVRNDPAWLIEIVAGVAEPGEDPETTAKRECIEEAGYAPYRLDYLGQYYVSPGGPSERITLSLGWVDRQQPVNQGGGLAEEHEDIRCFWLPRKEAMDLMVQEKINSGAPMLALLLAFGSDGLAAVASVS